MKQKFYYLLLLICSITSIHVNAQWKAVGNINQIPLNGIADMIADKSGNLYLCGYLQKSNRNYFVAKYNGTDWAELGPDDNLAANDAVTRLCTDPSGNIYATGEFTNGSGQRYIAKFDGSVWKELGESNKLNANGRINSMVSDSKGNIYATGEFKNSKNQYYIAKYDGNSWSEINFDSTTQLFQAIWAINVDGSDNIYASVQLLEGTSLPYYVMKYSNNKWEKVLGNEPFYFSFGVGRVVPDKSGNLYTIANREIVKYDGTKWFSLGKPATSNLDMLSAIAVDSNGQVFTAGYIKNDQDRNYVATYANGSWKEFGGAGSLDSLAKETFEIRSLIINKGKLIAALSGRHQIVQYDPSVSGFQEAKSPTTNVQIYPNPATNYIEVSITKDASYTLTNLQGQSLRSGNLNEGNSKIDLENMNPGVYLLHISGDQQCTKRIVKN